MFLLLKTYLHITKCSHTHTHLRTHTHTHTHTRTHLQAYLGSLVLAPHQLAAAHALLASMLATMGLQPPLSTPPDTTTDRSLSHTNSCTPHSHAHGSMCADTSTSIWCKEEGEGGWGGVDTAAVAHIDLTTSAYAHSPLAAAAPTSAAEGVGAKGNGSAAEAAAEREHVVRPHTMLQPSSWPRVLSGSSLASR